MLERLSSKFAWGNSPNTSTSCNYHNLLKVFSRYHFQLIFHLLLYEIFQKHLYFVSNKFHKKSFHSFFYNFVWEFFSGRSARILTSISSDMLPGIFIHIPSRIHPHLHPGIAPKIPSGWMILFLKVFNKFERFLTKLPHAFLKEFLQHCIQELLLQFFKTNVFSQITYRWLLHKLIYGFSPGYTTVIIPVIPLVILTLITSGILSNYFQRMDAGCFPSNYPKTSSRAQEYFWGISYDFIKGYFRI